MTHSFLKIEFEGAPVDDERIYTVGLQDFHYKNITKKLERLMLELVNEDKK